MEQRLLDLVAGCSLNPGAPEDALETLTRTLGLRLPADYLSLMSYSNGLEGFVGENYLALWAVERVRAYGVYEDLPSFVFIGSNGGGEGYAYDTRSPDMPIVSLPFIGGKVGLERVLGKSLAEFLERLHAKPL
jgi:hypothetical protein